MLPPNSTLETIVLLDRNSGQRRVIIYTLVFTQRIGEIRSRRTRYVVLFMIMDVGHNDTPSFSFPWLRVFHKSYNGPCPIPEVFTVERNMFLFAETGNQLQEDRYSSSRTVVPSDRSNINTDDECINKEVNDWTNRLQNRYPVGQTRGTET